MLQHIAVEILRLFRELAKGLRTVLADVLIRVLAIRHDDDAHLRARALHDGQSP